MNTFTKFASAAACAAALSLPLAAPAWAGEQNDDIVVTSPAAMEQWQAETTKDLNRALAREPLSRKVRPNNSIVEVAFTMGADGRAENVEVIYGNGNWAARRAAKYAVNSLDTLDSVPVTNREDARFLASIIFANDKETHDEIAAKRDRKHAERFAAAGGRNEYILLGG